MVNVTRETIVSFSDRIDPATITPETFYLIAAGKWRTVASATVSEDGSVIRTDPGEGVVAPGWHAVPPRKRPTIAQCQGEGCDQDKEEEDEGPDEPPAEPIRIAGTFATPVAAFDFGTANSALEENHQRVSATLDYTSERGYGWLNGQRTALDRGSNASTSPLTQDFIETPLAEFAVDLERGIYEVTVTMGDASQRRVGGGAVYEEKLGTNLTTEAGQFQTSTRRVIIDDGQLNLRFLGLNNFPVAVNAITVSFVADVPAQSLEPLEGVRFYALEQLDTGFTLRGSYTSRKEFLEGLLLVPNAPYRLSVFHPGPMSYGFTDFSSSSLSDGDVPVPSVTLLPTIGMDSDDDGLITPIEVVLGTAPNLADTDEDGISDLAEIQQGLNPLDDRGFPTGIVGTLPTNGSAARLVVTRTPADPEALTAYVATSRGVSVVDVSDFDNPTTLGEYPIAGGAMDVAIDATGDVLLAATRSSVHQFDVSDPVEVRLIRELPQPASRLETLGGFGLFASGEVLWSVDLANGETVASQIYTAGIGEIARDGELLYLLVGNRLQITQIDAGTFIERGMVSLPTSPGSLTVGAGIAYVTSQIRGGYMTIDVTDPDNPVLISESDVEAPAILPWQTLALNGSGLGMLAGAVQGQGRVDIVQTLDPTETNVVAAQIEIGNVANDVEIAAGIAFLANGSAGLQVFNYLPFDSAGNAPQITLDSAALDSNPQTPAIEVVSRSVQVIVPQTTDDVQVRSVELLMDGEVVVRDVSFPFNLPFIAPRLSADKSEFVIQVRATDTGGNTTTTQPTIIELVPDTTAPELVAAEPDGQRVYPDGLTRVALQFNEPLDGQQLSAESVQLVHDELGVIVPNTFELRFGNRLIVMTFDPLPVGDYSVAFDSERIVDLAGNAATSADLDINFSLVEGTIFWVGGDGNWNDPQNWDLERVPNESDIVRADVASDATITISANVNVLSLRSNEHIVLTGGTADFGNQAELAGGITIDGGTLAVTNELRLAGESSWRSGTVSGIGRLENHGNLQIGSTGVKYLDGTLINRGAIDLAEGAVRVRRTASTRPIQLVNAAAGTFTFSGAGQVIVQATGDNRFVNQGTLRIDTGELAAQIAIAFDNQGGTIKGESGELDLRGGGVSTGGVIQLGPGTLLDYESGEHTFTGDYSGSGEGLVGLSGSASITVPAGESATFALAGGGFLINGGNMVPAGQLTISGDGQFLAGTLGGPGTVTNQGNLQISSASVKYLDGTLINRGTIDFTEGAVRVRRTASDRPIRLVNAAEGIFEVSRAGQVIVQASGDNGVLNRGLMRIRAAAALTVSMELLQEASGTIQFDVTGPAATDHGQLRLSSTATLAGTLQVVVPSVEDIPSGTELELISLGNQGSEAFTTIDTGGLDAQLERRLNSMLLVVA
jgi:hypothetical protein